MKAQRIRISFSKTDAMRYTGHLDLRLTWERTIRRSGLPLAYSEGYSPKPLFNFALPLPLGFLSTAELGDFWFSQILSTSTLISAIRSVLPPGLAVHKAEEIPDLHSHKLPTLVRKVSYVVPLPEIKTSLPEKITALLDADHLPRTRRGKEYDLRPLIHSLSFKPESAAATSEIRVVLSALPGATGRPDEVLDELGFNPLQLTIIRSKIHLNSAGS